MIEMIKCSYFRINPVDSVYCFSCEKMNMEFNTLDKCYSCKGYEEVE